MRLLFLLVCFSLLGHFFTSCSQQDNTKPFQLKAPEQMNDTSSVAVIAFDQNHDWPFKHTYKPTTLSEKEIALLDSLLKQCVSNYNQSLASNMKTDYGIDFVKYKYKRQYMAVLNDQGQKEIWINGFCDTWDKQWKKEVVLVHDGGNCYFNLKINLTTKECFELSVNGYA